jgi:hypothetical protein
VTPKLLWASRQPAPPPGQYIARSATMPMFETRRSEAGKNEMVALTFASWNLIGECNTSILESLKAFTLGDRMDVVTRS